MRRMTDHNFLDSRPSPADPQPRLLQANGVTRRSAGRLLLDGVSMGLEAGDRMALVGATGSGKTLLLRGLAMLDPLDGGEVLWRGQRVSGAYVPLYRSRVIYLHQRPAIVEGTVEDYLRQPFLMQVHRARHFVRRRIVSLLESLQRDESFLAKLQRDLSGGEAQLAALLRAMQLDPNVLLLDEPTAALDAATGMMVEKLIANWLEERPSERATVWVSHDMQQAQRVSNRTIHMAQGVICIPK